MVVIERANRAIGRWKSHGLTNGAMQFRQNCPNRLVAGSERRHANGRNRVAAIRVGPITAPRETHQRERSLPCGPISAHSGDDRMTRIFARLPAAILRAPPLRASSGFHPKSPPRCPSQSCFRLRLCAAGNGGFGLESRGGKGRPAVDCRKFSADTFAPPRAGLSGTPLFDEIYWIVTTTARFARRRTPWYVVTC
jgi:hypothetical protein